ncbi:hypothetical protein BBJ28_00008321 [Nothophytophthora sp. Chile5]|nr:hypothetical protein BBJ28_00008321 [Nothophytophthora sp. Chile5]
MPFVLPAGALGRLRVPCESLWPRAPQRHPLVKTHPPRRTNPPDRTNRLRIGTFNVQSLGSLFKQLDTLLQDLRRYRIDILGLQETKLYDLGRFDIDNYTLLTLPAQEKCHGVGFAVSPRLIPYLHRVWAHSDRIGVLEMRLPQTGHVNVVTAYAPHSGRPLTEVDTFYADLRAVMDQFSRRDITFITGDFNAKLGRRVQGETFLGRHARGARNRNGHALADFCDTYHLFATNTDFQKRAKNKTT